MSPELLDENYVAYSLTFYITITSDHHHPAHKVSWSFFKNYLLGELLNMPPNHV